MVVYRFAQSPKTKVSVAGVVEGVGVVGLGTRRETRIRMSVRVICWLGRRVMSGTDSCSVTLMRTWAAKEARWSWSMIKPLRVLAASEAVMLADGSLG